MFDPLCCPLLHFLKNLYISNHGRAPGLIAELHVRLYISLLNDFRKLNYQNFLSFSFSIYRNRISFPILCYATVL